jgi:hypothetical protein
VRRADARTLLPDACHAIEEAWYATQTPSPLPQLARPPLRAQWAQLVGFEALLMGACGTIQAARGVRAENVQAVALLLAAPQAFDFVTRALDAMLLPRPLSETPMACELCFVGVVETFLGERRSMLMPRIGAVREAYGRLQRSGVLEARKLAGHSSAAFASCVKETEACWSAANERAAQRGLRACALPSCGAREAHVAHFKLCGRCSSVAYCGREHQIADWPAHKAACKKAAAAAAAAASGAGAAGGAGPSKP